MEFQPSLANNGTHGPVHRRRTHAARRPPGHARHAPIFSTRRPVADDLWRGRRAAGMRRRASPCQAGVQATDVQATALRRAGEEGATRPHTRCHGVSDISVKSYPSTTGHLWRRRGPTPVLPTMKSTRPWQPATAPVRDIMRVRDISHPRRTPRCAATRSRRRARRRAQMLRVGGDELRDARARLAERAGDRAPAPVRRRLVVGGARRGVRAAAVDSRGGDGGGVVRAGFRRRRRRRTVGAAADGGRADAVAAGERAAGERARPAAVVGAAIEHRGGRRAPAAASARPSSARPSVRARRRRRRFSDWSYEESAATMSELQPTRGRTAGSVPASSGGEPSLRAPSRPANSGRLPAESGDGGAARRCARGVGAAARA